MASNAVNYHILHQAKTCSAADIWIHVVSCHELLRQLGASLRSREGCEALSIVIVWLQGLEVKCHMAQKIDHGSLPWIQTMAERQYDLKIHIINDVVKTAIGLRLTHHHKNQEIRNMNIACDISRSLKYC